jgi:hypothetical protein
MAKKEYAFYPGCSSQKGASASNYLTSVNAMCDKLDVTLTEIPDWNCCGASIGYAEGGELPRLALSARNFALAETHMPGQADGRHLRRLLAGPARSQGAHRPQRGPAQGNQRGAGRCRPAIPGHHADPPHGRGAGRGSRLRRAEAAGGEAARRHQVCRLRRLPDQPPLRHRRRILREPGVPRQAGGDRGRRGRALRPEGHLLRRRAGLLRAGEDRRSRSATSSSRPTTTAPK